MKNLSAKGWQEASQPCFVLNSSFADKMSFETERIHEH